MEGVFISRELDEESVFRARMAAANIPFTAISFIEFEAVPFSELPITDWIFFYSKKSVDYFFKTCHFLNVPNTYFSGMRWACMGAGTAKVLQNKGFDAHFVGSGAPESVANSFSTIATGDRVLFPRAQYSRQSIQKLLHEYIQSYDLVVYTNKPKSHYVMESRRILVFTSPLNAEAYFYQHKLLPGQRIVAIGNTTAAALRKLGFCELKIANAPTEAELAKAVFELYEV